MGLIYLFLFTGWYSGAGQLSHYSDYVTGWTSGEKRLDSLQCQIVSYFPKRPYWL